MEQHAIQVSGLNFHYKDQLQLIAGLNMVVGEGERFGLFGPNGAGKTTLMSLMTGLLPFKEGHIELFGKPVSTKNKEVKKLFGFVPQDFSFYPELTPTENLEFFGAWCGLSPRKIREKAAELFDVLHLTPVKNKQVKKFSGGMKRKVNLAIGVIHEPRLLFLDEPTVGVDVQTRHDIIHYLKQLNAKGTTLFYTSHQLNEAQELCNKIALMDEGKIIAFDSLDNLLASHLRDDLESLFIHLTGKAYKQS